MAQKGRDYSREAIISNTSIAHWNSGGLWKSCPKNFVIFSHKIMTSNKLNMGFLSVPNLVP